MRRKRPQHLHRLQQKKELPRLQLRRKRKLLYRLRGLIGMYIV
jgi:hypothetical protein